MYIAMKLVRKMDLSNGLELAAMNAEKRITGCLFVFETAAAAREHYGEDCELVECSFAEPQKGATC
jgi:hypothetical protein